MDLKIKDVAELLSVSETTIRRWLSEGKIPGYKMNGQYRFARTEIEAWMMGHRINTSFPASVPELLPEEDKPPDEAVSSGIHSFSLYRAIHRGGVYAEVPGTTKEEVIRATMLLVARRFDLDAEVLTELLLDRERLMPTALGHGIAVPHTRDFLLNTHFDVITAIFPQQPIEYGSLDGKPVHTLFFLFACEDKRHLHLLAKLAHLSGSPEAQALLLRHPEKQMLLRFVKEWEARLQHSKPN